MKNLYLKTIIITDAFDSVAFLNHSGMPYRWKRILRSNAEKPAQRSIGGQVSNPAVAYCTKSSAR